MILWTDEPDVGIRERVVMHNAVMLWGTLVKYNRGVFLFIFHYETH